MPYGGPPPLWGQAPPFSHRSWLCTPEGLPGLRRPMGIGLGSSNGTLPSSTQNRAVVGLSHPNLPQRAIPRYRPGPLAGSRDPYIGYSGHSTRNHPSPSHPSTPNIASTSTLAYPTTEHEMGAMSAGGHQLVQNLLVSDMLILAIPSFILAW